MKSSVKEIFNFLKQLDRFDLNDLSKRYHFNVEELQHCITFILNEAEKGNYYDIEENALTTEKSIYENIQKEFYSNFLDVFFDMNYEYIIELLKGKFTNSIVDDSTRELHLDYYNIISGKKDTYKINLKELWIAEGYKHIKYHGYGKIDSSDTDFAKHWDEKRIVKMQKRDLVKDICFKMASSIKDSLTKEAITSFYEKNSAEE